MIRIPILLLWNLLRNIIMFPFRFLAFFGRLPKGSYVHFEIHKSFPRWEQSSFLRWWRGEPEDLTLQEWRAALDKLARSKRVDGIVCEVHELEAGWPALQEFRALLLEFQEKGKDVVLYFHDIGASECYLGSAANRVIASPAANVHLTKPAAHVFFFGAVLQKFGVQPCLYQVGEHKSAPEIFLRHFPSPTNRADIERMLADYREQYFQALASNRAHSPEELEAIFHHGIFTIEEALEHGIVDAIRYVKRVAQYLDEENPHAVETLEMPHLRPLPAEDSEAAEGDDASEDAEAAEDAESVKASGASEEAGVAESDGADGSDAAKEDEGSESFVSAEGSEDSDTAEGADASEKGDESGAVEGDATSKASETADATEDSEETKDAKASEAEEADEAKEAPAVGEPASSEDDSTDKKEEEDEEEDEEEPPRLYSMNAFEKGTVRLWRWTPLRRKKRIAVIPIQGTIRDSAGGNLRNDDEAVGSQVIEALKEAEESGARAAVVFIDSRGGSGHASEAIWWAVKELGASVPVVAYMDNYAASGGYYIACAATTIIANPWTLTGSIGVFGGKFVAQELLQRLQVGLAVVGESPGNRLLSPFKTPTPEEHHRLASQMSLFYSRFLARVAESRNMSTDEVHERAQGKVYYGHRAKELNLVDECGGFREAFDKALSMAEITDAEPVLFKTSSGLSRLEMLMENVKAGPLPLGSSLPTPSELHRFLHEIQTLLTMLSQGKLIAWHEAIHLSPPSYTPTLSQLLPHS